MRRCKPLMLAFLLALPFAGTAQTETEPNNSTGQANTLAHNTAISGSMGPCTVPDNSGDYFKVTTPFRGRMQLNMSISTSGATGLPVTANIYNVNGSFVSAFTFAAGASGIPVASSNTLLCAGEGIYYISLVNPSSNDCTQYSLSYQMLAPVYADDAEPNSTLSTSDTASAGNNDGTINFAYGDNSDYYRLVLADDGKLLINWSAENAGPTASTADLNLYNINGSFLQSWNVPVGANGTAESQTVEIECRGNEQLYYLLISSNACGTSYRFTYNVESPLYADDDETGNGNDSQGVSDTVAVNLPHEGRINFYYDDNADYYRLVLNDDGVLNIHTKAEHPSASTTDSLTLNLYNINGSYLKTWRVPVGASSVAANGLATIECRGNEQLYYLLIQSDACGVSYRFSYDVSPPLYADDAEGGDGNDSFGPADTVAVNVPHEGRINFYYDDNADYYRLLLNDDGVLNIHTKAEHPSASITDSLTMNLYNINGSYLQTWRVPVGANSAPANGLATTPCKGNEQLYYLHIQSDACGASYQFSYDVSSPEFGDDMEPNNGTASAQVIDLDQHAVDGRINFYYDDNGDYFKIVLPAQGAITMDILAERPGDAGSMPLNMYNVNGSFLESSTVAVGGGSSPASTTFTSAVRPAGTYYILFTGAPCGTSYQIQCNDADNDGTCNYFDLCPNGPEPGTACDDGTACTIGDVIDANCNCTGTPVLVDDSDPCTLDACDAQNGVTHIFQDADGDGTCDANDLCSNGPEPGTSCDDGNSATINDIIGANCQCTGTLLGTDCEGVPGGPAVPGTTCNDNDACTTGDVYDANCQCAGTFADADGDGTCDADDLCANGPEPGTSCDDGNSSTINDVIGSNCQCNGTLLGTDCEGVPGGPAVPGTACNDNDACTTGDVYDANCQCAGTFADADGDGTCDAEDLCANGPEPGTTCDDGNANTENDVIDASCTCTGIPVNPCNEEKLVLTIALDNFGSQTTWEIRTANEATVIGSGGPYADGLAGTTVTETMCVGNGCYKLRVFDANGDGIANGGYVLRDGSSNRIIDANGEFTDESYLGRKFCLPTGTAELLPASCDLEMATGYNFIQGNTVAGASQYQFWVFDPHGNNEWAFVRTNPMLGPAPLANIPHGINVNVRVRAKVNGHYQPFGPACRLSTAAQPQQHQQGAGSNLASQGEFQVWPNPNNGDRLSISLTGADEDAKNAEVVLFDATGRQAYAATLAMANGSLGTVLDLGSIATGVYMLRITAGNETYESRVLVANE
jgi:hypothetical protein